MVDTMKKIKGEVIAPSMDYKSKNEKEMEKQKDRAHDKVEKTVETTKPETYKKTTSSFIQAAIKRIKSTE